MRREDHIGTLDAIMVTDEALYGAPENIQGELYSTDGVPMTSVVTQYLDLNKIPLSERDKDHELDRLILRRRLGRFGCHIADIAVVRERELIARIQYWKNQSL